MKVFLAGEGRHELGDWVHPEQYREKPAVVGLVEALLLRLECRGWKVIGAIKWQKIVKLRPGQFRTQEMRNVRGAALHAQEAGADLLVFVRDRDGQGEREDEIKGAIDELSVDDGAVRIAGGVAAQQIEAWILALRGQLRTESINDSKSALKASGVSNLSEMVSIVRAAVLAERPGDAVSLSRWLTAAKSVLAGSH